MEIQKGEPKSVAGEHKRFIIPSQETDGVQVRSLFQAPATAQSSCLKSAGSYADYIFQKESKGPELKPTCEKGDPGSERKPTGEKGDPGSERKLTCLRLDPGSERKLTCLRLDLGSERKLTCLKLDPGSERKLTCLKLDPGSERNPQRTIGDSKEVTASSTGLSAIPGVRSGGGRSCIVVSTRQRGNPLLKHVRNIPWEFGDIVPDYVLGETCCALFLSLRYHNLNPEYIHNRLRTLGQSYALRVLLVQVDVKDPHHSLKELAKICILSDCTLILSWSPEEAARYLETYKCYEQKPADALKERTERDFMSRMTDCLTTVKSVNKTDSCTLLTTFGTLSDLANASREDLSLCPGLGPQKAKRLFDALHEPFLKTKK